MTKATFTTVSIFFFVGSIASAQTDTLKLASVLQKSLAIASRMERELSLTASQTQQVVQLALERFDNLKMESSNAATRFETVNQRALPKLAVILTKEQYARYLELREETKKQKNEFLKKNPGYIFSDEDMELDF